MRRLIAGAAMLMASGCSANECLMDGAWQPNPRLVLARITGGQAGRDAAEAVMAGDVEAVTALVRRDPRVLDARVPDPPDGIDPEDGEYGDLLTLAVARCDEAMVRALLALGASPNGANYGSPLDQAVTAREPTLFGLLLDAGADPDPEAKGGADLFMSALSYGGKGAVMMLLRHGRDPNREGPFGGGTMLDTALATQHYDIAHLLLDHGANPWIASGTGATAAWELANMTPILRPGPEQDDLHAKLIERVKRPGLPWPPPDLLPMRRMMLSGEWPTVAARAAGVPPLSEAAKRYLATYYDPDGEPLPPP